VRWGAGPVRGQRKEEAYRRGATPYVVVEGSRQGTSSRDSSCRKRGTNELERWKEEMQKTWMHGWKENDGTGDEEMYPQLRSSYR
jgi:hypothetical protein